MRISEIVDSVENGIINEYTRLTNSLKTETQSSGLLHIGRPHTFSNEVDRDHRIGLYLKTKMSMIDLIPCSFKIDIAGEDKRNEENEGESGLAPKILFKKPIDEYKSQQLIYGLEPPYDGVRIFTTDDTVVSDTISNQLKENFFQRSINKLSEIGQNIADVTKSSGMPDEVINVNKTKITENPDGTKSESVNDSTFSSLVSKIGSMFNLGDKNKETLNTIATAGFNTVAKGHRVSLPQIWSDSSYQPNMSVVLKLASPYGHPKAIAEFIIKPLMYLILLGSPRTWDGVAYGQPHFVKIMAYGLNYTPIGIINNITFRRGGNDTSFNIYRQPLTIDVTIDFLYAIKGFACEADHIDNVPIFHDDNGRYPLATEFVNEKHTDGSIKYSLPTLGNIVKSLRPVKPEQEMKGHSHMKPFRNTKIHEDVNIPLPSNQPINQPPNTTTNGASSSINNTQAVHQSAQQSVSNSMSNNNAVYRQNISMRYS